MKTQLPAPDARRSLETRKPAPRPVMTAVPAGPDYWPVPVRAVRPRRPDTSVSVGPEGPAAD